MGIQESLLIVEDRSTHEEHLSQPLKTNDKQHKVAVTFLTCCNGNFNITKIILFARAIDIDNFSKISLNLGADELESLDKETKMLIIEEGFFHESNHPFKVKTKFSTLGSITERSPGRVIQSSFLHHDSRRNLLGFKPTIIHDEYNLSNNPADIFSFDNIFLRGR